MKRSKAPAAAERNQGMLLIVAIFIMLILFMISSAFICLVSNDYLTSSIGISTTEAFWFGDAGVDYMVEEIRAYGIYSPFIPDDLTGYSGTGWGMELYSPCLLSRGSERGYFAVKVRLHPDDWKGRGQFLGVAHGSPPVPSVGTYPAPYASVSPYPDPNKFRPYLLEDGQPLRGISPTGDPYEPRLNRLIILSTGFIMTGAVLPPHWADIRQKKSIFAVYSMTTEEIEVWTELLH